ncbi:hypothetical protein [Hyalangium versicolor]|uniref:hypothetical protein n=1 Tax=Hyalangium versicolor TaxID=2861190 RepID=UPI001CCA3E16|nr:hypothetical protein [Hyalangium versicolor]
MDASRLSRGLGWWSVGLGLAELTFAEQFCQRLGFRGRLGLVRAHGLREVLKGLGLLTQRDPRPWLWGRLAGDAFDLCVLGVTLRRTEVPWAWKLAVGLTAAGLTVADALAVRGLGTKQRSDVIGMDVSSVPMESWRGSGLAEDVGMRQSGADAEADDALREQRMREAQEQLGLPDPDSQDMHRV